MPVLQGLCLLSLAQCGGLPSTAALPVLQQHIVRLRMHSMLTQVPGNPAACRVLLLLAWPMEVRSTHMHVIKGHEAV